MDRLFLACKGLLAAVFFLSGSILLWPAPIPAAYLLPFLALALLAMVVFLEKEVKAALTDHEALKSANLSFRFFRHELMNHLQIISCLCQLGKQERLFKALGSLNEKLKIFGEISGLSSPKVMQALGELLFSLPTETQVTFINDNPFTGEENFSEETAEDVRSLTACLRESGPREVSLKISLHNNLRFLVITAAVADKEAFWACRDNKKTPGFAGVQWQAETRENSHGLLICSIPLGEA